MGFDDKSKEVLKPVGPNNEPTTDEFSITDWTTYEQILVNADKNIKPILSAFVQELYKEKARLQGDDYYTIHPDQRRILNKAEVDEITIALAAKYKELLDTMAPEPATEEG